MIEELCGDSLDIKQDKIQKIKEIMPELFSEGKIDFEKVKNIVGDDLNINNERYVLNWAGKSEAIQILQTPTKATLEPSKDESVNFDNTENIFIEGENLEVLKVLQKSYYGKIKMIYIDPPYNTGSDSFIYPDKFSETEREYLERINEKTEDGILLKEGLFRKNSKENGQYHSNWLSMMYPRLFLAKNLLKEDGVIFVSIDDNEVHNLRLVMNEIFGEENFVAELIWQNKKGGGNDSSYIAIEHEYIIVYAKNKSSLKEFYELYTDEYLKRYKEEDEISKFYWDTFKRKSGKQYYPITCPDGTILQYDNDGNEISWLRSEPRFLSDKKIGDVRFIKIPDGWSVQFKQRLPKGKTPRSIFTTEEVISNHGTTSVGSNDMYKLFKSDIFSNPKPIELIKFLLGFGLQENDIILDFFSGSGTTAHSVMDLNKEEGGNRKFICVQLPEKCDGNSQGYKAGYKTIAEISKERIRRVIQNIHEKDNGQLKLEQSDSKQDLGFKVFKLKDSNFKKWQNDFATTEEELKKQLDVFKNPIKQNTDEENILWELLLKSGYDLNTLIEEKKFDNIKYFSIENNRLVILLSGISQKLVDKIIQDKPKEFICLDSLFENNDKLKANTSLQMQDSEIKFKTI